MPTAAVVVDKLKQLGYALSVEDGKVKYQRNEGAVGAHTQEVESLMEQAKAKKEEVIDLICGRPHVPRAIPDHVAGGTHKIHTGCGTMHFTINSDTTGPVEMFANFGKNGGCAEAYLQAVMRVASIALQYGAPMAAIAQTLKGITCPRPMLTKGKLVSSCADGIAKAIEEQLKIKLEVKNTGTALSLCPTCQDKLIPVGGCLECPGCGYRACEEGVFSQV
jgi:hypothetical protein